MDTSREYIKMCEAAIEIRHEVKSAKPDKNMFYSNAHGIRKIKYDWRGLCDCHCTWLPRLDQLVELVDKNWWKAYRAFDNWWYENFTIAGTWYCQKHLKLKERHIGSLEQAWFAFVMEKKYNKTWNGKEWING